MMDRTRSPSISRGEAEITNDAGGETSSRNHEQWRVIAGCAQGQHNYSCNPLPAAQV
jgi:hypothetical protein